MLQRQSPSRVYLVNNDHFRCCPYIAEQRLVGDNAALRLPTLLSLSFRCHAPQTTHRKVGQNYIRPPHMNVSYAADVLPYVLAPQAIDTDNDNVVYPHRYRSLV